MYPNDVYLVQMKMDLNATTEQQNEMQDCFAQNCTPAETLLLWT